MKKMERPSPILLAVRGQPIDFLLRKYAMSATVIPMPGKNDSKIDATAQNCLTPPTRGNDHSHELIGRSGRQFGSRYLGKSSPLHAEHTTHQVVCVLDVDDQHLRHLFGVLDDQRFDIAGMQAGQ